MRRNWKLFILFKGHDSEYDIIINFGNACFVLRFCTLDPEYPSRCEKRVRLWVLALKKDKRTFAPVDELWVILVAWLLAILPEFGPWNRLKVALTPLFEHADVVATQVLVMEELLGDLVHHGVQVPVTVNVLKEVGLRCQINDLFLLCSLHIGCLELLILVVNRNTGPAWLLISVDDLANRSIVVVCVQRDLVHRDLVHDVRVQNVDALAMRQDVRLPLQLLRRSWRLLEAPLNSFGPYRNLLKLLVLVAANALFWEEDINFGKAVPLPILGNQKGVSGQSALSISFWPWNFQCLSLRNPWRSFFYLREIVNYICYNWVILLAIVNRHYSELNV